MRYNRFSVFSNSIEYQFLNNNDSGYSNSQLYNVVQIGDEVLILYAEKYNVFLKKYNSVVDARTDTEVYRSIEQYNDAKKIA